jgi:UDP-glucose:(galactosyl)LPS alpha-1,2-glucosyltransferase
MNNIPIVFSFNHFVLIPAGVCINSLLRHANKDTFYDIFILHGDGELDITHQKCILQLKTHYPKCNITFLNIGNTFNNVHVARGVPKVTYYRFLIPKLLPNFDKVIFSDPDIIFKGDLSDVFNNTDLDDHYLAAVRSAFVKRKYIKSIGCDPDNYTNGGFQIYNLKAFRDFDLDKKQLEMCGGKYFYLDQDITNIVCRGKILFLPPKYNATQVFFKHSKSENYKIWMNNLFSEKEIIEGLNPIVHHFNGIKPWNGICFKHDIYWEEFRNSIYFDENIYYNHYIKLMNPTPSFLFNNIPKSIFRKYFGTFKSKYIDQRQMGKY